MELPPHNLSKVAPSTTRTPLLIEKRRVFYQITPSNARVCPHNARVCPQTGALGSEALAGDVQTDAVQVAADAVERAPEVGRLVMRVVQDNGGRVERLAEAYAAA